MSAPSYEQSLSSIARNPVTAFNDLYSSFLFANASRLSKVESTARSLTWFVPASSLSSEGLFTALNLLTLYHDALSNRTRTVQPSSPGSELQSTTSLSLPISAHARYTKYWLKQSKLYKAIARLLSVISYAQLLLEMAGKKYRGEEGRYRAVVAIESVKALLRLILLRLTSQRTILQPSIPEREIDPSIMAASSVTGESASSPSITSTSSDTWKATRTGFEIPTISSIRNSVANEGIGMMRVESEISAFLQRKVLTIDSVRRPYDLVRRRKGLGVVAEVVWILRPLIYVLAMKRYGRRSLQPFLLSLALEYFSYRNMADSLAASPASSRSEVEKQELSKRSRSFWLYFLRGPVWEGWTKGKIEGFAKKFEGVLGLGLLSSIAEDYKNLIDEYHYYSSS